MLEIINGYKKYKNLEVLNDINLKFEDGKMYAIIGANGSGKSLILKALSGYNKLTSGKVLQNGNEIRKNNNYIEDAGIIIENPVMVNEYTITENLEYLKKMSENSKEIDLEKWYKYFEIEEYKEKRFSELSLGTKQKVALIQAFMHNPKNILLDEPFNALDKKAVIKVKQLLLEEKKKGKLIVIVTHINDEILEECDEVIEMENGKVSKIIKK
ncbi:MAG: ATP-binding cassette domain-containing protein [Clostridiales bacterium]|nr:ATP-binding cassette domain-containing protein [Clostridiales bacterium]